MISQIGQDEWVCKVLNNKTGGFFLDIGAFDGVQISNTLYLENFLDWTGICVEAGPINYKNLCQNRKCICLHAAVTDKNGRVKFTENWTGGKVGEGPEVKSMRIDKLLKDYHVPHLIDYISLDVEGSELSVLSHFPFDKYHVNCWTIEHNAHLDGGEMRDKIRELMKRYDLVSSGHGFEDWFLNKNLC